MKTSYLLGLCRSKGKNETTFVAQDYVCRCYAALHLKPKWLMFGFSLNRVVRRYYSSSVDNTL